MDLKALIKKHGVRDVMERTTASKMTVYNWINGRCVPSVGHAKELEEAYPGEITRVEAIWGSDYLRDVCNGRERNGDSN